MRTALVIYCFFLAVEAALAWIVSGNPFLAAAVFCSLIFYASVWKAGNFWGEIVRGLSAGLIAVAGPLFYKGTLLPTILCFIALPHLLAATQCFWEMALANDPSPLNRRMRMVVFTVAFYAAMGLVFVLLTVGVPGVSPWITGALAVVVLLAALPAWDLARIARLKPGRLATRAPRSLLLRRVILLGVVLGLLGAVFSGVLPSVADRLCEISPRWRAKVDTPDKPRPKKEDTPPPPQSRDQMANRPGLDNSSLTGQHQLPSKANLQSTGQAKLFLRFKDREAGVKASANFVYVRSHTLDAWNDGVWRAASPAEQWLTDEADGTPDGLTTIRKTAFPSFEHTVFFHSEGGTVLPAIQGVSAFRLPKVLAGHGAVFMAQLAGPVRYDAISAPAIWDLLPARHLLRVGTSNIEAQTRPPDSLTLNSLVYDDELLRPGQDVPLEERIKTMRQWFLKNVQYSKVVDGKENLAPLDNFVIGERRGYCDFYATAAALMLRYSAIPTRVAYGYAGRTYDGETGVFTFTDDNAHAWTEIYLANAGWTVCDFTPPQNIGDLTGNQDEKPPGFKEEDFQPVQEPEQKKKTPPGEDHVLSVASWWDNAVNHILTMDPMTRTMEALKWLGIAAALFFLIRMAMKKTGKAGAGKEEDSFSADEHQPPYYAEFLRIFREAGCPRPGGSTPREYYSTLHARGLAGAEFDPMIHYHYRSRYTDDRRSPEEENAYMELVKETERRMREARAQQP